MKDEVVRVVAAETGYRVFGVGEYTSAGVWNKLYLSLNGRKFLEYANGTTYFFHTDHLGTPRVQSNLAQLPNCKDQNPLLMGVCKFFQSL
jgi:hypothetical protein